jgi:hypothetical protein
VLGELTVPHLRGSPEPSLMHLGQHGVVAVASVVETICSYAGSRPPTMGLVIAVEMPAGKVEEQHGEAGMTGRLEVEDQLGRLRTRGPGGLRSDLLSESPVLGLVVLVSGLAVMCGRLESVA